MRILIVNGPNLNLIGTRKPEVYGSVSLDEMLKTLSDREGVRVEMLQSNLEGELINIMQKSDHDGIILNAGGYSHTSVSIRDCVEAIQIPVVEVHISNITSREEFRHTSLISPVAIGCIFGFGLSGYELALDYFQNYLNKR